MLRSIGYDLISWGAVAGVAAWPLWSALRDEVSPGAAVATAAAGLAAGALLGVLNRNRAAKLCVAGAGPRRGARAWWPAVLVAGAALTAALAAAGVRALVPPFWLLLLAIGHLAGPGRALREVRALGAALAAGGLAVGALALGSPSDLDRPSAAALGAWLLLVAAGGPAAGTRLNRRLLHVRAARQASGADDA